MTFRALFSSLLGLHPRRLGPRLLFLLLPNDPARRSTSISKASLEIYTGERDPHSQHRVSVFVFLNLVPFSQKLTSSSPPLFLSSPFFSSVFLLPLLLPQRVLLGCCRWSGLGVSLTLSRGGRCVDLRAHLSFFLACRFRLSPASRITSLLIQEGRPSFFLRPVTMLRKSVLNPDRKLGMKSLRELISFVRFRFRFFSSLPPSILLQRAL